MMVSAVLVNPVSENFLERANKILKAKGYKVKQTKESALIDYTFTNGQGESVTISGWHGTGNYGHMKLMMDLYKGYELQEDVFLMPGNKKGSYGQGMPVTALKVSGNQLTQEEFKAYKENIEKAIAFLEKL